MRRALRFGNDDANAVLGLGSLALIQHEFRSALTYGRRAEKLLPAPSALALVGAVSELMAVLLKAAASEVLGLFAWPATANV